jgi:Asp-tRNA(Asn)/Glu-tRNA(Gln) amidotransferase A subunit family amidase
MTMAPSCGAEARDAPRLPPAIAAMTPLTLSEVTPLLRQGDISAETYAADLMDWCERERDINAFLAIDRAALAAAARAADLARRSGAPLGPLHGAPLAFKDNINTSAMPTTAGTKALEEFRPQADAAVARRLFDAGALLLGKTNLHELSMGWTGNNATFGPAHNPHDHLRTCGGSSSGTACAVTAGLAPAGLGTDTNGSLRIPAALCGIASLRPTVGRYPTEGIVPLSPSLDTVGAMARSVADLALLDTVMSGQRSAAPRDSLAGLRIGLAPEYFEDGMSPDVSGVFASAIDRLVEFGADIVRIRLPDLDRWVDGVAATLIHFEAARALPDYLKTYASHFSLPDIAAAAGDDIREILIDRLVETAPNRISEAAYKCACEKRRKVGALLRAAFCEYQLDLFAYPTTRVAAPLIGDRLASPAPDFNENGFRLDARTAFGRNVAPTARARMPSLVLPAGASLSGLPVGIEFAAPEGEDAVLLAIGFALESGLGPARGSLRAGVP